jgi:hypothetical protein
MLCWLLDHAACVRAHAQTELETARKAQQAALEAAGASEQRAHASEVSKPLLIAAHTTSDALVGASPACVFTS